MVITELLNLLKYTQNFGITRPLREFTNIEQRYFIFQHVLEMRERGEGRRGARGGLDLSQLLKKTCNESHLYVILRGRWGWGGGGGGSEDEEARGGLES